MKVEVVQFVLPHGRKAVATTEISDDFMRQVQEMITCDCRFEAEVLRTGEVSVTISNSDEDLDIRVIPNGPGVQSAMEEMLRSELWLERARKREPAD